MIIVDDLIQTGGTMTECIKVSEISLLYLTIHIRHAPIAATACDTSV